MPISTNSPGILLTRFGGIVAVSDRRLGSQRRHVGSRDIAIQSRQRRLAETLQIGKVYQILYFSQSLFTGCRTQLAFPHSHHFPSHFSQFGLVALVTAAVTSDFILPKFHIRVREMPIDAISWFCYKFTSFHSHKCFIGKIIP